VTEATDDPSAPYDSSIDQPPKFESARHSVLTPEGEIESMGSFARGLGGRRMKWLIAIGGGLALLIAAVPLFS
jgi:hypothetical protein